MRYVHLGGLPRLVMFGLLCSAWGSPAPARANEFKFTPSLSVSEEYNDNILETATGRRTDFVTRVAPGALLLYRAPNLGGDLNYAFDYRNYARGTRGDETRHTLSLHGSAALTPNFLYLDLSDTLSRVSLDITRDVATESNFLNQTDQNIGSVSPYLLWHPGEKTVLKTGYRYTDTRYWAVAGGVAGIDKQQHQAYADLTSEITTRLSLNTGYSYSQNDTGLGRYDQHEASAGFRYQYADQSFVFGSIGNNWRLFPTRNASDLFWSAGLTHDFGQLLVSLETVARYSEDPLTNNTKQTDYSARVEKKLQHGRVGLASSYTEFDEAQAAVPQRRRLAFSGFGRYELSTRLAATAAATADRVSRSAVGDYPYHFNGSAGLSYGFNYDITASLSYTRIEYRRELESTADARQTNRVILEVRKVF